MLVISSVLHPNVLLKPLDQGFTLSTTLVALGKKLKTTEIDIKATKKSSRDFFIISLHLRSSVIVRDVVISISILRL
jgi:hypothetical protein